MPGLVDAADQEQAPDLEIACMRSIYAVAVRFERHPRCAERLRRPGEIARDECDLGLGNHTPRAGHRLFRTEGARSLSQESFRSNELAELRHRDASQRERRRVVTQGDPLQCAERITCRECARRSGDQRVHRNPVTLVTPTPRCPVLIYRMTTNQERRAMTTHMTGTRKEWLAARLELLKAEKEVTRRRDGLGRRRQGPTRGRISKKESIRNDEGSGPLAHLL